MYECQQKSATTWGSHLYMLLPALTYSAGAILEIGVGHNSSILMNTFSLYAGRRYLMVEEDKAWLHEMRIILPKNPHREMILHPLDDPAPYENERWGLAFVDGPYGPKRRIPIAAGPVKDCARYVLFHDTSREWRTGALRETIEKNYKYFYHFNYAAPNTTIASNFSPVDWIKPFVEAYKMDPKDHV